jgi:hypothetical protein
VRRYAVGLLVVLLAPVLALGDHLKIVGVTRVAPYKLVRLKAEGLEVSKDHPDVKARLGWRWSVEPIKGTSETEKQTTDRKASIDWAAGKDGKTKEQSWVAPPGDYKVTLRQTVEYADGFRDNETAEVVVTILPPGPRPPNPIDPVDPVDPVDPSKPAPIPLPGLRVLVIYDYSKKSDLTSSQREVIDTSEQIRQYLRSKCVVTPTSPDGAYRIVDYRQKFRPGEEWTDALARLRGGLPWVIISNGKTGYEGPLGWGDHPQLGAALTGKSFIEFVSKYEVK